MIQLISDNTKISAMFKRVPDALIKFSFVVTTGSREFMGPSVLLTGASSPELHLGLTEYLQRDDAFEELQADIWRRLGYKLPYYPRTQEIPLGYSPTDILEIQRLRLAGDCRAEAADVLLQALLRYSSAFRVLGHLNEIDRNSKTTMYFVYSDGRIWASRRQLTDEQWCGLIRRRLTREEAALASVTLKAKSSISRNPRFISTQVRMEVWRRDEGRCVECGSQERLEFDHFIPVAMGGSCTARNIQLLCESCNRQKSDNLA